MYIANLRDPYSEALTKIPVYTEWQRRFEYKICV